MRHALWESIGDQIRLEKRHIAADKEEAKNIWLKLLPHIISDYLRSQNLPGANPKNIKRRLNGEATQYMTLEMLKEWDLKNEVLSWICDILQLDISTYI